MKITVDGEVLEFDGNHLSVKTAMALHKASGQTPVQFSEGLRLGDPTSLAALVWLAKRQSGQVVPFDDIDFDIASLVIDDGDEQAELDVQVGPTPSGSEGSTR